MAKRRCYCTPRCGRCLSYRTRCRHYQAVREAGNKLYALSSTISSASGSDSSSDCSSSSDRSDNDLPSGVTFTGYPTHSDVNIEVRARHQSGSQSLSSSSSDAVPEDDPSDGVAYETPPPSPAPSPAPDSIPDGLRYSGEPEDLPDERTRLIEEVGEELVARLEADAAGSLHDALALELTEEEHDNVCAFRLRFLANVSRTTYNKFRHAFRGRLHLNSDWVLLHRVAALSGLKPEWYECCINSCVCYLGQYADADRCPIPECAEPRWTQAGIPRRYFCYIPFIPRLQAMFRCIRLIKMLRYRDTFTDTRNTIKDVFSSAHYKRLCKTQVDVDGTKLPHCHFSDSRDIALALSCDGYLLFKRNRGGPSATPLLLLNYNLPPEVRTHLENLICVGVIGGPLQPKHLWSFLVPFEDECARVAHGVRTFDALRREFFLLHVYCIFCLGDILAIMKLLNMRGVNAVVPCRSCRIRGVLMPGKTNYYVPLEQPHMRGEARSRWDPKNLPLRTHEKILAQLEKIRNAPTATYRDKLARSYGIRTDRPDFIGPVLGHRVRSALDYAHSFPWEWMHLFSENNVPNLIAMWMGRFKDLDGRFVIPQKIWEKIRDETRDAIPLIPSSYIGAIPDLLMARDMWSAETWAFWFMYIAPIVLRGRFLDERYYKHMCNLIEIMHITLKFEIRRDELEDLREKIILWVNQYEQYYYQYKTDQLNTCLLVVHGLLHIVDDILHCGPMWATWTFFMERFCGKLKRSLTSRSRPWANLDRRVLNFAHASQITAKYNLEPDDLFATRKDTGGATDRELLVPGYPLHYLRRPCFSNYALPENTRRLVGLHLASLIGGRRTEHSLALPHTVPAWAKLRIGEGGDSIRTYLGQRERLGAHERDSSYVRYDGSVRARDGTLRDAVQYGKLLVILELSLAPIPRWKALGGTTLLLAFIRPCKTRGEDAATQLTLYQHYRAETIIDLSAVQAVVGRVRSRNAWGIIDRSHDLARAVFTNDTEESRREDEDDDSDQDDLPEE